MSQLVAYMRLPSINMLSEQNHEHKLFVTLVNCSFLLPDLLDLAFFLHFCEQPVRLVSVKVVN